MVEAIPQRHHQSSSSFDTKVPIWDDEMALGASMGNGCESRSAYDFVRDAGGDVEDYVSSKLPRAERLVDLHFPDLPRDIPRQMSPGLGSSQVIAAS